MRGQRIGDIQSDRRSSGFVSDRKWSTVGAMRFVYGMSRGRCRSTLLWCWKNRWERSKSETLVKYIRFLVGADPSGGPTKSAGGNTIPAGGHTETRKK